LKNICKTIFRYIFKAAGTESIVSTVKSSRLFEICPAQIQKLYFIVYIKD